MAFAGPVVGGIALLLGMYREKQAEHAMQEAALRLGLDLSKDADYHAAAAYVYVQGVSASGLRALTGGDIDRDVAAMAIMRAERAQPGLLGQALNGHPPAQDAVREAVRAADLGVAIETRDDEERELVAHYRALGYDTRKIETALDNYRARQAAKGSGQQTGGPGLPPSWIPDEVIDKLPLEWGTGSPIRAAKRGKDGWRWQSPFERGSGVRVDKGDPNSFFPSQRVDHVVINSSGKVIGRNGLQINGSIADDHDNAHIPLTEYVRWQN